MKIVKGNKIDLYELIYSKENLVNKYIDEVPVNIERYNVGNLERFSRSIDMYYLHLLEECYEVKIEKDPNRQVEEIVDVINYLATLNYIFIKNCSDKEFIHEINEEMIFTINSDNYYVKEDFLDKVNNSVFEIRRTYPERKWHKENNRDFSLDMDEVISKPAIEKFMECIKYGVQLVIYKNIYYDLNLDINNIICGKHEYIDKISI